MGKRNQMRRRAIEWRRFHAIAALLICSCSRTTLEVKTAPDGSRTARWSTSGTWNGAPAMPLKDYPPPPDIGFGDGTMGARSFPPAAGTAVELGDGVSLSFRDLQHSDAIQARGQAAKALADDALMGYAAHLLSKIRITRIGAGTDAARIKAGTEAREIDAATEAAAIRAKTERISARE